MKARLELVADSEIDDAIDAIVLKLICIAGVLVVQFEHHVVGRPVVDAKFVNLVLLQAFFEVFVVAETRVDTNVAIPFAECPTVGRLDVVAVLRFSVGVDIAVEVPARIQRAQAKASSRLLNVRSAE